MKENQLSLIIVERSWIRQPIKRCKIYNVFSESMNYVRSTKPENVVPMHDAVLSELGKTFNNNWIKMVCDEIGAECAVLDPNESLYI